MRGVPKNSMRSRQRPWDGQPDSRIRRCRNKCYSTIYKSRGAFLHVKVVLPDITNLVPGGRSTTEKSRWRRIGHRTNKTFPKEIEEHRIYPRRISGRSHFFPQGAQEGGGAPWSGHMLRPPGTDTACREPCTQMNGGIPILVLTEIDNVCSAENILWTNYVRE